MRQFGSDYERLIKDYVPVEREIVPFFSSVSGKIFTDSSKLGPSYWRSNLESPVLFYSATKTVLDRLHGENIFVEIGPHSALGGPLRQTFKSVDGGSDPTYIPTIVRGKDCTGSLLAAAGQLHLQGVPINFQAVTPGKTALTNLPTYPWRHETKYWNESRITREWRMRRFPPHELLGCRILEGNELEPTWRNMLRLEDVPWVRDHKVLDDVVFPAAGYIAMAGEAIQQVTNTDDFTLRHVDIKTALVLQDSKTAEIMSSLHPVPLTSVLDSAWYEFCVSSYNGTSWTKHCMGQVRAGPEEANLASQIGSLARKVPASAWYSSMKRTGLNYGPSFQDLTDITAGPSDGTAVASISDRYGSSETAYQVHPTTIDMCLQLFTVGMAGGIDRRLRKLCVPTSMEELYIGRSGADIRVQVSASASKKGAISGDAVAMADGDVILSLKRGRFTPLEHQDPADGADAIAAAQLHWKPDIDFAPADKLMRQRVHFREETLDLERLALLCMLETRHRISSLGTDVDHLKKFQSWLDLQHRRAESGIYDVI